MPNHVIAFKLNDGPTNDQNTLVTIEVISLWLHTDFIREVLLPSLTEIDADSHKYGRYNFDFFGTQALAAIVSKIKKTHIIQNLNYQELGRGHVTYTEIKTVPNVFADQQANVLDALEIKTGYCQEEFSFVGLASEFPEKDTEE